jgi:hypothetical protein
MTEHLSEDDIERMRAFVDKPRYKRTPEQLIPGDETDE